MSLCLCGCGSETNSGRKYIIYHRSKVEWTEGAKKKQSVTMIKLLKNEEFKKRRDDAVRKVVQSDKYRKNHKKVMKKVCNKQENKDRVSIQVKENWKKDKKRKLEMSIRMKKKWKNKKERKKQSNRMKVIWKSEAYKKNRKEGMNKLGVSEKIALGGKKRRGSNNPAWNGGTGNAPYCYIWGDKEYRESIKERDNFKCKHPDCWDKSDLLVCHHINYDKKDCRPVNLITLCNSCNARVNVNREQWTEYFMEAVG